MKKLTSKELQEYLFAISNYDKEIELNPMAVSAYFNRATCKNAVMDFQGAIADLGAAIEHNPEFADAYYRRGELKGKIQDYHGETDDYNKAIEIDHKYALRLQDFILDFDFSDNGIPLNFFTTGRSKNTSNKKESAISEHSNFSNKNDIRTVPQSYISRIVQNSILFSMKSHFDGYNEPLRESETGADLLFSYNRGFKLRVLNECQLRNFNVQFEKETDSSNIVLVVTNNNGDLLTFDSNGNIDRTNKGQIIYFPFRVPSIENIDKSNRLIEKIIKSWEYYLYGYEFHSEQKNNLVVNNIEPIYGGLIRYGIRPPFEKINNVIFEHKKQLEQTLLNEIDTANKVLAEYKNNPDKKILLDFTGGEMGFVKTEWTSTNLIDISNKELWSIYCSKTLDFFCDDDTPNGRVYLSLPEDLVVKLVTTLTSESINDIGVTNKAEFLNKLITKKLGKHREIGIAESNGMLNIKINGIIYELNISNADKISNALLNHKFYYNYENLLADSDLYCEVISIYNDPANIFKIQVATIYNDSLHFNIAGIPLSEFPLQELLKLANILTTPSSPTTPSSAFVKNLDKINYLNSFINTNVGGDASIIEINGALILEIKSNFFNLSTSSTQEVFNALINSTLYFNIKPKHQVFTDTVNFEDGIFRMSYNGVYTELLRKYTIIKAIPNEDGKIWEINGYFDLKYKPMESVLESLDSDKTIKFAYDYKQPTGYEDNLE